MKKFTCLTFAIMMVFCSAAIAQKETINFLYENCDLSIYVDNGNKDIDIPNFNTAIVNWHKESPEFDKILPLRMFSEFWLYDETCYPIVPELTEKNANFYDILFEKN
jgi:hypothetical protein